MIKLVLLLLVIGMSVSLIAPADAVFYDIVVNSFKLSTSNHLHSSVDIKPDSRLDKNVKLTGDYTVYDFDKCKDCSDTNKHSPFTAWTDSTFTFDPSVDILKKDKTPNGDTTTIINQKVLIARSDFVFEEPENPGEPPTEENPKTKQGRDEGGAPHKSGVYNVDLTKFYFGNVVEQPTCTMSNTEIFCSALKATDRLVPVYYNWYKLPGYFDVGVQPEEGSWLYPGNKPFKLPFDLFYSVSGEGILFHHGEGYQHVNRDLNGMKLFNEKEDGQTNYEPLRPQHNYKTQQMLASHLRS